MKKFIKEYIEARGGIEELAEEEKEALMHIALSEVRGGMGLEHMGNVEAKRKSNWKKKGDSSHETAYKQILKDKLKKARQLGNHAAIASIQKRIKMYSQ